MYTQNKNFIFTMIAVAIAIGNAGSTLYLPALVTIAHKLNTTNSLVKISLACYLLTFGLSQLLYGPMSDAWGRKKVLISGLGIFLLGSIIASLATNISLLLCGRLIEGAGIGAANAVGYALIRDIYSGNELTRKLSYVSIFVGITPIIAPLCGGYLVAYFNWQACFIILSILAFGLILMQLYKLPETNQNLNKKAINPDIIIKNYYTALTNLNYLSYILAVSVGFAAILCLNSVLPFIMIKNLGVSPSHYGWLTLCTGAGYLSGSFVGGVVAVKFGAKLTIKIGAIIQIAASVLGLVVAFFFYDIQAVLLPLIIVLFGVGFIVPIGAGGAMAIFPQMAGSAAALLGTMMFGISSIFTSLVAHLPTETQKPLFIFLLFLGALAWFIVSFIGAKKNV